MIEHELRASGGQRRPADAYARLLLVIGAWALLIGGVQLYAWQDMLSMLDLLQSLVNICRTSPFGPLFFIGAAMLSPLLLIPAALLGSVAGLCFGPIYGVIYTIIGCNLSATITYSLGRISGGELAGAGWFGKLIGRYGPQLRNSSLLGVVMLRLSFPALRPDQLSDRRYARALGSLYHREYAGQPARGDRARARWDFDRGL